MVLFFLFSEREVQRERESQRVQEQNGNVDKASIQNATHNIHRFFCARPFPPRLRRITNNWKEGDYLVRSQMREIAGYFFLLVRTGSESMIGHGVKNCLDQCRYTSSL